MSKASMMYAFDHIPVLENGGGGNVGGYSDFPFTFGGNTNAGALGHFTGGGTVLENSQTWLSVTATSQWNGFFWPCAWRLPISNVVDLTKPRNYIGFRFKANNGNASDPFIITNSSNVVQTQLVKAADYTFTASQEYYIEVLLDRVNKTRTVWIDGVMIINAQTLSGGYAVQSTDLFAFGGDTAAGSYNPQTYRFKDMYFMNDPGDGSVSRLGPQLAKPITLASSSGAGWVGNAYSGTLSGTMAISAAQSKFGGSSLFPGATTSSLCSFPDAVGLRTGATGDATYEGWVYNTLGTQTGVVFGKDNAVANSAHLTYANGNWNVFFDSSTVAINVASGMPLNAWVHVALVRYQGTWSLYQNGALLAQFAGGTFGNNTYPFIVGNWGGANAPWQGYIDEVRVSNVARYTGAFTPPSAPFVPDANTMGLFHFDVASGSTVVDSSVNPAQQLNTAINTTTPSTPNVSYAVDGTPLVTPLTTTADPSSVVNGVLLLASGTRNAGTSTVLRGTLSDQATPTPNQAALTGMLFAAGAFQYGRTMGFLPNALDGSNWSASKINALTLSSVASPT
jgi:hypothetical protein